MALVGKKIILWLPKRLGCLWHKEHNLGSGAVNKKRASFNQDHTVDMCVSVS
jgi:hypothetical protein